ncbi:hypothetical protein E0494_07110 [Marinilabiliaceae bacterium JC040]|nr:hypothetical protein [Marinilabiliaceae bacterium JC040]
MRYIYCTLLLIVITLTTKAQSKWELGLNITNGISSMDRQALSNSLNNRNTFSSKMGYTYSLGIFANLNTKSGKSFHQFSLFTKMKSYNSEVYDSRLSITKGNKPKLFPTRYSYNTINLGYSYNRYILERDKYKIYLGIGSELSYNYKNTIYLELSDGDKTIKQTDRRINENFFINYNPTIIAQVGIKFDIWKFKSVCTSFKYTKDMNYFIKSSIPMFSTFSLSLDIPIWQF